MRHRHSPKSSVRTAPYHRGYTTVTTGGDDRAVTDSRRRVASPGCQGHCSEEQLLEKLTRGGTTRRLLRHVLRDILTMFEVCVSFNEVS